VVPVWSLEALRPQVKLFICRHQGRGVEEPANSAVAAAAAVRRPEIITSPFRARNTATTTPRRRHGKG